MKPCGCPDNLVCAYCVPARVMDPKRPARCSVCDKPKAIPADFAGDTQAADLCWSRAPFEACREKAVDWRARALKAEVSAERCPNCDLPGPCKLGVVEKFAADHPAKTKEDSWRLNDPNTRPSGHWTSWRRRRPS